MYKVTDTVKPIEVNFQRACVHFHLSAPQLRNGMGTQLTAVPSQQTPTLTRVLMVGPGSIYCRAWRLGLSIKGSLKIHTYKHLIGSLYRPIIKLMPHIWVSTPHKLGVEKVLVLNDSVLCSAGLLMPCWLWGCPFSLAREGLGTPDWVRWDGHG